VFVTSATGQQIKCLTVIDEWTREALAIDVAGSIRAERVIELLARIVSNRGAPRDLRWNNGPEFVSSAILRWITTEGIKTTLHGTLKAIRVSASKPDTSARRLSVLHGG